MEKPQRRQVRYRTGPSKQSESESLLQPHLKREDDEEQEDVKLLRDKYSKDIMRSKYGLGGGHDAFELDETELRKLHQATSVSTVKSMTRVPQTVMPSEDFQLVITIVDGRKFEGSNPNPYVFVNCAGEERVTEIQYGTATPYFNQVYVIEFNMPSSQILDQVLVLTVRLPSFAFTSIFTFTSLLSPSFIDFVRFDGCPHAGIQQERGLLRQVLQGLAHRRVPHRRAHHLHESRYAVLNCAVISTFF